MALKVQFLTADGILICKANNADRTTYNRAAKKAVALGYNSLIVEDATFGRKSDLAYYMERYQKQKGAASATPLQ